jgi:stage II sporulation protein E
MVTVTGIEAYKRVAEGQLLTVEERTSFGVILVGVMVGIGGISFFGLNFQSMISRWIVLWGALFGGPGGGAAIGAAVGLVPSIQGVLSTGPIAFFALAGLMGGIFNGFNKIGVVVGFALANLMLSLFYTEDIVIVQALKETGIAVLGFLVFNLPLKREEQATVRNLTDVPDITAFYSERLLKMADIFYELERVFKDSAGHIEKKSETGELNLLFNKVTSQVCEGCSLKRVCWEQDFYKTYKSFIEACTKLEAEGVVSEQDFGSLLKRRCMRLRELSVAFNSQLEMLKMINSYDKKLNLCRCMVNQQIVGLAKIVEDFSGELRKDVKLDDTLSDSLVRKLMEKGVEIKEASVLEMPGGDKEILIKQSACQNENFCSAMVAPNVSQILDRIYVLKNKNCSGKRNNGYCTYCLGPSRLMQINIGKASSPKEGEVSGDVCTAINLPHQRFALILCDGMGVGQKAYDESSAAVSMLEKFLLAGFSPAMAVRTANTVLLLKSPQEKFVTLDVVIVNQVNGHADFIKTGAAPSLICSKKGLKVIESSSPPVGILDDVEPNVSRYILGPQNCIIMLSDGVWDSLENAGGPDGWLEDIIKHADVTDPQMMADYILYIAKKAGASRTQDDMCVLVANLEKRNVG